MDSFPPLSLGQLAESLIVESLRVLKDDKVRLARLLVALISDDVCRQFYPDTNDDLLFLYYHQTLDAFLDKLLPLLPHSDEVVLKLTQILAAFELRGDRDTGAPLLQSKLFNFNFVSQRNSSLSLMKLIDSRLSTVQSLLAPLEPELILLRDSDDDASRLVHNFIVAFQLSTSTCSLQIAEVAHNITAAFINAVESVSPLRRWTTSAPLLLLPPCVQSLIDWALVVCKSKASVLWPRWILTRVGREDLWLSISSADESERRVRTAVNLVDRASDGLLDVEKSTAYRFLEDERFHEVARMLNSSKPLYLKLERAPDSSDLEHRRKMQLKLLSLCRRSLSYPLGRAMATFDSSSPLVADALAIPKLCLVGRVAPNNTTLPFDPQSAPVELTYWPEFHNGSDSFSFPS